MERRAALYKEIPANRTNSFHVNPDYPMLTKSQSLSGDHVDGQEFLNSFDAVKLDRVIAALMFVLFMAQHQISR